MSTAYIRKRRYPYRLNGDEYTMEKRTDEVLNETIEMIQDLDAGETISSVTVDMSGPTVSSEAVASGIAGTNTAVTFTITGTGVATFKMVTSASRTLERRFRWIGTDDDLEDYKN